jgi:hypothetical protein
MSQHTDPNAPLDPQPESRSLLDSIWFHIKRGLRLREAREKAQEQAAADNAPIREADARRKAAQDGGK